VRIHTHVAVDYLQGHQHGTDPLKEYRGFEYCSLPVFYIYRGGTEIYVRPNRCALARSLGVPLEPDELALHKSATIRYA
jgi:hypothetical protein